VGIAGIAIGGHGVHSRDGKARDHCRHRVSVGDGRAPGWRRVDAGVGGGGRSPRTAFANIVIADTILARWREEDAARLFSGVETGGVARGGSKRPTGPASP
jgi:hypothetical protein